jgi:hypothetical protein
MRGVVSVPREQKRDGQAQAIPAAVVVVCTVETDVQAWQDQDQGDVEERCEQRPYLSSRETHPAPRKRHRQRRSLVGRAALPTRLNNRWEPFFRECRIE